MPSLQHYRSNLRHLVRPDTPSERVQSPQIALTDWEALYARMALREWATYGASGEEQDLALAYAEYIDYSVREEDNSLVELYAHTEAAQDVLRTAFESDNNVIGDQILQYIDESFCDSSGTVIE